MMGAAIGSGILLSRGFSKGNLSTLKESRFYQQFEDEILMIRNAVLTSLAQRTATVAKSSFPNLSSDIDKVLNSALNKLGQS